MMLSQTDDLTPIERRTREFQHRLLGQLEAMEISLNQIAEAINYLVK